MIPVLDVYHHLNSNIALLELMDSLRVGGAEESTIFRLEIPENYRKVELAPLIRIESITNFGVLYSDNERDAEEQRVQISSMTRELIHLERLIPVIDSAMKELDFEQYDDDTYIEPDLSLNYNARKYIRIKRIEWSEESGEE